jgi:hypothetical protein
MWTYEDGVLCASHQFGKFAVVLGFGCLYEKDQPLPQTLAKLKRMKCGGNGGRVSLDSDGGPYISCSVQEGMLSLSFVFGQGRDFWADLPVDAPAAQNVISDLIQAVIEGSNT